jgi:ABC-type amino acid transport substrate-binding protein
VLARRTLRVGYFEDRMPFSFHNAQGELVGHDVEMAAQMAQDLGVALELVAVTRRNMEEMLATHQVDLVSSLPYTPQLVRRLRMSQPYMDGTIGLMVRDSRRDEFKTPAGIRAHERLVIGVLGDRELSEDYVRAFLGETPYVIAVFDTFEQMLDRRRAQPDAVVVLAEAGMAWSLLHPEFSVVIPQGMLIRRPLAYALATDADRLGDFVDEWVTLQQARGNFAQAYDYWVLGEGTESRRPRWSIARDVLGWLD